LEQNCCALVISEQNCCQEGKVTPSINACGAVVKYYFNGFLSLRPQTAVHKMNNELIPNNK